MIKKKMRMKTIGVLLIAGLAVLSAMVVFAGTAAAQEEEDPYQVTIYGYITYPDGSGVHGAQVEITKELGSVGSGNWESVGVTTTNETGYYTMTSRWYRPLWLWNHSLRDGFVWGNYRMYLDGQMVEEKYIPLKDWTWEGGIFWRKWSYQWNYEIPEFATIAIPAVAVLGLFLFYSHRKRKEE